MPELEMGKLELSCDQCWRAISKASFLVLTYVNEKGEPRSSGVLFGLSDRHLGVLVNSESWKARSIKDGQVVAVSVVVRKGGILSMLLPIPPATVNFHARAIVHAPGTVEPELARKFAPYHPDWVRKVGTIIELVPEGKFMTYGIGVPFTSMTKPEVAMRHAPIS